MNKIKGMVIGASQNSVHSILKAKEKGIYVIALDGNLEAEGLSYADKAIHVDISNKKQVCKIVEQEKPDFIIPVPIGKYLSIIGYINDTYNLKGINYKMAEYSVDKYLFHNKLNNSGLRPVQLYLLNRDVDINKISLPFPAVMKPRFGSGSRDVFYIKNHQELKIAYNYILTKKEDFVLEEAVAGFEYGVDGAVINKKLQITLVRKKIITPLPVRQAVSSLSVLRNKDNELMLNRIYKYLQNVIAKLNYDNCLINADIIMNDKEIFVIEIAPRPSGHYLHDVFVPYVTGIDIADEYTKFLLGKDCTFQAKSIKCMQIRFFDFEDVKITKVPTKEELGYNSKCNLKLWKCNINVGDMMGKVSNGQSIMGRGFFIVEGSDEKDLLLQSEWILSQFESELLK